MSNKLNRAEWSPRNLKLIDAHTAECVAEAVGEAVRGRYAIGEKVQCYDGIEWEDCEILSVVLNDRDSHYGFGCNIRRPPVTRQMTDEEKLSAIASALVKYIPSNEVWHNIASDLANGKTLEAMAKDLQINTTVEE